MKVSLNWLQNYIDLDMSPEEISDILTAIGLEVEGMEEIESIKGGLEGIVVGHVLECGQHPNADKLSLCKVDVGAEEPLQIVCGAPNVSQGQKVLVATIGTTLYTPEGEAWKIKKGKIRGKVSEGMICAEDELGLGESHDGIMVLPEKTAVGRPASELFDIGKDIIYEIGLTPNRSDATCHIGVAEDLAAYLQINHNHSGQIKYPDTSNFQAGNGDGGISIEVLDQAGAPRFSGILIDNITIAESPDWLKKHLQSIGVNTKNNIVDITNFILHEIGQPLHAYDAEKIGKSKIKVQNLQEGATYVDLDGKERTLHPEDVMVCDGDDKGMCIGGVYGGLDSGVSDTTTKIFLEAAHFNANSIRKTSTRHLLRTDAAVTFEKGSDPSKTVTALKRATLLMQELAGATVASQLFDIYPEVIAKAQVPVKYAHINRLIGANIPKEEVKKILSALKIEMSAETADDFIAHIPTNKADVTREADVIEEILRIYGFNKVEIPQKVVSTISYKPSPDRPALRNKAANVLCGLGFSEMMAISLNQSKYYESEGEDNLVYINNTSNIHLNVMRADMVHSALEAISYNINRQESSLKLFEFGRAYWKEEGEIQEREKLSLSLTGNIYRESSFGIPEETEQGFYYVKGAVNQLLATLGVTSYQVSELESDHFLYGLKYHRGPNVLCELGMLHPDLCKNMGVKQEVFYAEADWESLIKAGAKHKIQVINMSKFPKVRRDLALVLADSVKFQEIEAIAKKTDKKILKEINLFDVYKNDEHVGKGKKSYAVSFEFQDDNKTLKDKDVDKVMNALVHKYEKDLGAHIRK